MKTQYVFKILLIMLFLFAVTGLNAQTADYPYRFRLGVDLSLIPAGVTLKIVSDVFEDRITLFTEEDIENLDSSDINGLDRFATGLWNPTADKVSDVFNNILLLTPAAILIPELVHIKDRYRWQNLLHLGLMYTEVYFLTMGFTNFIQSVVQRTRPYLYNSNLSIEERLELAQDLGAYQSFFSGHTSAAFAAAVFLSKVVTDIHGRTPLTVATWITSLSMATTVAGLRIASGKHYFTDVLAGAVIGSGLGLLVPLLHKKRGNDSDVDVSVSSLSTLQLSFKL
jgi:membrane-associated phospholipid phosphatase